MTTITQAVQASTDKTTAPPPLLYSMDEAARCAGIGRSKLYELIAAGEIESVKLGKRRLVPRDALLAFIDGLRAAS